MIALHALPVLGFLACVVGANWMLGHWGIVPIGLGLEAPAGVYLAGLAFTLRDAVRETTGRMGVVAAIAGGSLLSFWLEDSRDFAIASGVAFSVSETADALVYEPLRGWTRVGAVALSNTVGSVVDSALFLWLAFGSLAFIEGQIVGKFYATAATVLLLAAWKIRSDLPLRSR